MKKKIIAILSLSLVLGLASCDRIPKIPHITSKTDDTAYTEPTESVTEQTESQTEQTEETEPSSEPTETEKPKATATPTPTPKPTLPTETEDPDPTEPDPGEIPEPVVIITSDDTETEEFATCNVNHVYQGRAWRYEGLDDILTFNDDLITIEIPAYEGAADIINETLEYLNKETEAEFGKLVDSIPVPEYPQETENPKKDDKKPQATWTTASYSQTAEVVLCKENVIGIRYSYTFTDDAGNVTTGSEYLMFDLRTGDYISVEDLARSSGLFGEHLYYLTLSLYTQMYPNTSVSEETFAKELVKVKDSYDWEIVERDGVVYLTYWYPQGAFEALNLGDVVFEADFEQFSMYLTAYSRSILG
ncbi:MAG: hypothetical protein J6Y08_06350 [Clostridiales bacterium]|nr:hypothetical protein [Clostridiales bacterium]